MRPGRPACAALVVLAACGADPLAPLPPRHPPLLVLGIDGATRDVMDPLMHAGRLPTFRMLAERGVYASLRTEAPTLSPLIWTSIATGKTPAEHGIVKFEQALPGSELVSRVRVPEASRELRVILDGMAPPPLTEQGVALEVGGRERGRMRLSDRWERHEATLALEGSTSDLILRFASSAPRPPNPVFFTTALGNLSVSSDGGPLRMLTTADVFEGVYRKPKEIDLPPGSPPAGSAEGAPPGTSVPGSKLSILEFGRSRIITVSSNMRKVKAIWNILSDLHRPVLVAGYWATWPAERVEGAIISNYTWASFGGTAKGAFMRDFAGQTHPESLVATLDPDLKAGIAAGSRRRAEVAPRLPPGLKNAESRLDSVHNGATRDAFNVLASSRLLRRHDYDLAIVYLTEVDVVSHRFWEVNPGIVEGTIGEAYERADAALRDLLDAMDADPSCANVMVISDHGFEWNDRGIYQHTATSPSGVLLMAGPLVRPLAVPRDPGIMDMAPTMLALLGVPAARDMKGRILDEALALPPPPRVATYEKGGERQGTEKALASPVEEEAQEQLRGLGYIQ